MNSKDTDRYSRQILFKEIGERGQQKLLSSRAVIVGVGALGSFHAAALARAGVGQIVVIDRDYVEYSNLQRQWLFEESDADQMLPKAVAARNRLSAINIDVNVEAIVADMTSENAERLLSGADIILDGCDNFETRYLINDVAVKHEIPWIYGAAVGSYGLTMPILPRISSCLACIFPQPPSGLHPTCDTAGILNAISGVIASLQVADALKILVGRSKIVKSRLFTLDVWENSSQDISVEQPDNACRTCSLRHFDHLERRRRPAAMLCGRNAVQINVRQKELDLIELQHSLEPLGEVRANDYVVFFRCPPHEITIFSDGRAIVKGTADVSLARSLYARYVGI